MHDGMYRVHRSENPVVSGQGRDDFSRCNQFTLKLVKGCQASSDAGREVAMRDSFTVITMGTLSMSSAYSDPWITFQR